MRLNACAQALRDVLFDNRRQVLIEHARKHFPVDLHQNENIVEAIHLAGRSILIESKIDRTDATDRHSAELHRRSHVHALDGAINIRLDVNAGAKHLAGTKCDQPSGENRQRDDDKKSDAKVAWLLAHSASRRKKRRT